MEKKSISQNLLYNQNHFDILLKLYHTSLKEKDTLDGLYKVVTESIVDGLQIDRAGFWKILEDKLVCLNLFDREHRFHSVENDILAKDYPTYFKALHDGIAIVANDASTNKYTKEFKDSYLIPLGITDMLDVPILENGNLIGVLCCEHRNSSRVWSQTDLAFARSIGDIFALMIEQYRKRVIEKELIESERKLSLITEHSNDGFVVFENKTVTYISSSYRELLGYSAEEIAQMTPEDVFSRVHPEDLEAMKAKIYTKLSEKEKIFSHIFRFKNKDCKYLWREDTASVIYDKNGDYSKYIIISRDISEIKKAEFEIQKLYDISKRQNEKLLDFTHIISHNIRSNTSNMTMLMSLIEDSEDASEKEEFFQLLKLSNEKLTDTIYYLNETISVKLDTKQEKTSISLKSEVEKVLKAINGIVIQEKVEIKLDIAPELKMKTVPSYFESILLNLITNAIKYKSPARNPIIEIFAKKGDSNFVFEVRDNGIGIDLLKHKDKIFGMYKTFHGNADAVGLGLFMTKNHIEALGGSADVASEVGKGSTFKFTLYE